MCHAASCEAPRKLCAHLASNKTPTQRVLASVFAKVPLSMAARVHESCDPHFGVARPSQTPRHISVSTRTGYKKRPHFFETGIPHSWQEIIHHAFRT